MKKAFVFTMDDNIRFLQELTKSDMQSLFSHPYTKMLKELHEQYRIKVQLNLFYENASFNLSEMTGKYRAEWAENAEWLKLSFHSRLENYSPYENSTYEEVYTDCSKLQKQVLRFAGESSLAKTTTVHYGRTTQDGLRALKSCGVNGLLGLYGSDEKPRDSYASSLEDLPLLRKGKITYGDGIAFSGIDIVMDCFSTSECLALLAELKEREVVKVMIHEQYFYEDYVKYQAEYKNKLQAVFAFLTENGFEPTFFEDLLDR